MKANIVDLRYHMNDVLKALERNEEVEILYHGKVKGIMKAVTPSSRRGITEHPFFAMSESKSSVEEEMQRIRGDRYRDL